MTHKRRAVARRQDVEQIDRGDEVETRKRETLRLQVLGECFLAERQLALDGVQTLIQVRSVRSLDHVLRRLHLRYDLLEDKNM